MRKGGFLWWAYRKTPGRNSPMAILRQNGRDPLPNNLQI